MYSKGSLPMLVWMIIAVAGFTVIFFFIQGAISTVSAGTAEATCRGAVTAREFFTIPLQKQSPKDISMFPFICKTIQKDDVEGKKDNVIEELADLATRCWWQFGNGAYPSTLSKTQGVSVCFTCYDVYIKDIKDAKSIDGLELFQWMESNPYNRKVKTEDEGYKRERSYLDYIQMDDSGSSRGYLLVPKGLVFKPGQAYAVVYVEPHQRWEWLPNFWFARPNDVQEPRIPAIYVGEKSMLIEKAHCVEKLGAGGI